MKHEKKVRIYTMDQNSEEWLEVRAGKATGSCATLLLSKGKNDKEIAVTFQKYIYRKAGEWVTGDLPEGYQNSSMQRGHDLEPLARKSYEEKMWEVVTLVGFIALNHYAGCSPDGLVNDDGLVEIKCPEHTEFFRLLDEYNETGILPISKAYMDQVQYNLFITDRDYCDFVYFHPKFGDKRLLIRRVFRDEKLMGVFTKKIKTFEDEINRLIEIVDPKMVAA